MRGKNNKRKNSTIMKEFSKKLSNNKTSTNKPKKAVKCLSNKETK